MMRWRWSANVSRRPQADPVPHVLRQRLGRDHQRVHGGQHASQPGQAGGVALGRPHHDLCPHRAAVGRDETGLDAGHGGRLVHDDPEPLDRPRQAAHQSRRMDRRTVRCVRRAEDSCRAEPPAGLVGVEQLEVFLAEAPAAGGRDLVARAVELHRRAGQHDRAALAEVAVDALGVGDGPDLVDACLHRAVLRDRPVEAVPLRQPRHRRGEQRRAPATVASAGAEAGDLPLEHDDPQRRVRPREVVRGPEPGVPGSDDRDVRVTVAGQRIPRRPVLVCGVVPEGQRARVSGHRDATPRRTRGPVARRAGPVRRPVLRRSSAAARRRPRPAGRGPRRRRRAGRR